MQGGFATACEGFQINLCLNERQAIGKASLRWG